MKRRTALISLAKLFACRSFIYFLDSWLSVLNGFDFYFWWRDSENREYLSALRSNIHLIKSALFSRFQLPNYLTLYSLVSLSVFSLARRLQVILEIYTATYRSVSYLLADFSDYSTGCAQCMTSKSNVKLCSVRWCVCRHFLQNNL